MLGYLPTLKGRNKWRVTRNNISTGQLVLVGDAEDMSSREAYRLGRVHRVHPQWRNGKELVRRAIVAVLKDCGDGTNKIEYVLRDNIKNCSCIIFYCFLSCVFIFVFPRALLTFLCFIKSVILYQRKTWPLAYVLSHLFLYLLHVYMNVNDDGELPSKRTLYT